MNKRMDASTRASKPAKVQETGCASRPSIAKKEKRNQKTATKTGKATGHKHTHTHTHTPPRPSASRTETHKPFALSGSPCFVFFFLFLYLFHYSHLRISRPTHHRQGARARAATMQRQPYSIVFRAGENEEEEAEEEEEEEEEEDEEEEAEEEEEEEEEKQKEDKGDTTDEERASVGSPETACAPEPLAPLVGLGQRYMEACTMLPREEGGALSPLAHLSSADVEALLYDALAASPVHIEVAGERVAVDGLDQKRMVFGLLHPVVSRAHVCGLLSQLMRTRPELLQARLGWLPPEVRAIIIERALQPPQAEAPSALGRAGLALVSHEWYDVYRRAHERQAAMRRTLLATIMVYMVSVLPIRLSGVRFIRGRESSIGTRFRHGAAPLLETIDMYPYGTPDTAARRVVSARGRPGHAARQHRVRAPVRPRRAPHRPACVARRHRGRPESAGPSARLCHVPLYGAVAAVLVDRTAWKQTNTKKKKQKYGTKTARRASVHVAHAPSLHARTNVLCTVARIGVGKKKRRAKKKTSAAQTGYWGSVVVVFFCLFFCFFLEQRKKQPVARARTQRMAEGKNKRPTAQHVAPCNSSALPRLPSLLRALTPLSLGTARDPRHTAQRRVHTHLSFGEHPVAW